MDTVQSLGFFSHNIVWMGWNTLLAIVPMVLARVLQKSISKFGQSLLLVLWLAFLPNTLYMITDVIHLFNPRFGQMTVLFKLLGIALYFGVFVIAVTSFVLAMRPVLHKYRSRIQRLSTHFRIVLFIVFSLLMGFAIGMGRFKRTNTWYLLTQPIRVIQDIVASLTDPVVLWLAVWYALGAFVIVIITSRHVFSNEP
ncbi:DUF1361 domain-containing protein [Candidatus Woesebacteria bacterium]|nr:DUF1361 domain-containing protein [Candidatus Woesebacteria bacterium]